MSRGNGQFKKERLGCRISVRKEGIRMGEAGATSALIDGRISGKATTRGLKFSGILLSAAERAWTELNPSQSISWISSPHSPYFPTRVDCVIPSAPHRTGSLNDYNDFLLGNRQSLHNHNAAHARTRPDSPVGRLLPPILPVRGCYVAVKLLNVPPP